MDAEGLKQINSLRFSWHEHVLRDPEMRKRPVALVFAGHVMHRFNPAKGYAEISLKGAVRALSVGKTSIIRARDFMIERGWLQRLGGEDKTNGEQATARYSLAGGPDDLALDLHATKTVAPTIENLQPQLPFSSADPSQPNGSRT